MEDDDFDYTTRDAFQDVDSVNFFTPAETCMLAHRILSSIKVHGLRLCFLLPY